jgi:sec-independent protein translocase protein TatC
MTTDPPRPLLEHLSELRNRLFWIIGTWAGCSALILNWSAQAFELLMQPGVDAVRSRGRTLITIAPPELFLVYMKTALLAGFLISLPVAIYQVWAFVAPGLYRHEKRLALPFVLCTTLLFFAGAAFGHRVAFPYIFEYFLSLESAYVSNQWTMQALFAFLSRLYLAFGVAFELPVAMVFLAGTGVVSVERMTEARRYAIVAMFVLGAVLTPPDVVSQIMLSVPLVGLYEVGLLSSRLLLRRRARSAAAASALRT